MKTLFFIPFLFVCSMVIGQSSKIIGNPIKIGKLKVAQYDFPTSMKWNDAKKACADLGSGWRLPTKDELSLLYENKDKIGGFADNFYWSSTETNKYNAEVQLFYPFFQWYCSKDGNLSVRSVRSF
jgi:hypothetical protein